MENNDLVYIFEELKGIEIKARDYYNELLENLSNKHEIEVITSIRDDEIQHIQIAEKIINLINKK